VKRLLEQEDTCGESLKDLIHEVDILSQLQHSNVVLWLGACITPPNLAVVLEAIYTSTKHGPRGRSLNYILHKTHHDVSRLQALKWLEGKPPIRSLRVQTYVCKHIYTQTPL
jgi:hypothetical protein